jgi:hypothetical protein
VVIYTRLSVLLDAPTEWRQSTPQTSVGRSIEKIILKKDSNALIEITFTPIALDTPVGRYKTSDEYLELSHKTSAMPYVAGSVEGRYSAKKVKVGALTGYETIFNDASYGGKPVPLGEYLTMSRLTYLISSSTSAVIASVVLYSQGTESPDYKVMKTIVNSMALLAAKP